ncbi:MAG: AAA family ATPase [Devosia sp.]|uniref:AAA family ATPase n=1 Tax=Devosia sp. TaxID=1871048 RepID=UPI001A0BCBB6|nr:AAA family ATPase [Devosia sp.]MBF0677958.1 AAA family ATPase [Devosia sp.]
MKLTALRLHNVRRFGGRGVAIEGIGAGVNVLSAANEHGKSTAFEALHALFFQPHSGTGKAVQSLRPYSGGNPLVEADIVSGEGRFRLTKQFYGGKRASVTDLGTGRLIAQADEAEAFIAELTRGGVGGPAGLLWVRQGLTGIEQRSKGEEEGERRVRETLLTSVQGEVEALTGGRRMAKILAACEAELAPLVTATGRPKAGGRFAIALEELERLTAEEARLAVEMMALRDALERRRATRQRLAEVDNAEEKARRRSDTLAAEAAYEAARRHGAALKTAEAEADLARHRYEEAQKALAEFEAALNRAADLAGRRQQALERRDAALARRDAARADNEAAQAAMDAAHAEEQEQRALLGRLDAAIKARDAAEHVSRLRQQLEKAESQRALVEAEEAAFAALDIAAPKVRQLEQLDLDLRHRRASREATLPSFRIDYVAGAEGRIRQGGAGVEGNKAHGFAASTQLEIEGVGTLTLGAGAERDDGGLAALEEQHARLLAALGVDSLAAAQTRLAAAQEKAAAVKLARQRFADLAPEGLGPLQGEIARLAAAQGDALEIKGDPQAAREAVALAAARVAATRNAARELAPRIEQAGNGVVEAETALAAIDGEWAALEGVLGPVDLRAERLEGLQNREANARAALELAAAQVENLRPLAQDVSAAEASLSRVRSIETAANQEMAQLNVALADLNGQISTRSSDAVEENLQEVREQLEAARASVARFRTEVAVLERLRKELVSARSAARDLYLKPVVSELLPMLGLLFDDIDIVFDEDTLLPQTVRRNGLDEDVDRLSGGMREQLSILTRLAFARLLARDGRAAPVILDDALVYSDDDRIERMFDALHRQARDQQILVFSCRQRAFARLGGNVLQMVDWTPGA